MGWYYVTGNDESGRRQTLRVSGDNGTEALDSARSQGLSDPVLETDEIGANFIDPPSEADVFTHDELLSMRRMSPFRMHLFVVGKLLMQQSVILGGAIFYLIAARLFGQPWGSTLDWVASGTIVSIVLMCLTVRFWPTKSKRVADDFDKLINAFVRGDWQATIDLADKLQDTAVPKSELDFRSAEALAHLGRVEECLARTTPYLDGSINDDQCPEWMAQNRMCDVYSALGRYDDAAAAVERAAELEPGSPIVWIDVAAQRCQVGDAAGAAEAIAMINPETLSREIAPFVELLRARIDNEEGRHSEALRRLKEIEKPLLNLLPLSPLWTMMLATHDMELAICYAFEGDASKMRTHFGRMISMARTHNWRKALERWERLTAQAPCTLPVDVSPDDGNPYRPTFT